MTEFLTSWYKDLSLLLSRKELLIFQNCIYSKQWGWLSGSWETDIGNNCKKSCPPYCHMGLSRLIDKSTDAGLTHRYRSHPRQFTYALSTVEFLIAGYWHPTLEFERWASIRSFSRLLCLSSTYSPSSTNLTAAETYYPLLYVSDGNHYILMSIFLKNKNQTKKNHPWFMRCWEPVRDK